ncbi:MAG TPA: hypothetical protein VFA47_07655, partial [Candidatus Manganitrophaceae bacterium]|nr:hypothetical protein [Candidatus Manganitrophaceae bacterium]
MEKVDLEKIYLITRGLPCPDGVNPISVEIDASVKKARLFVDGVFWREQQVLDLNAIQESLERSKAIEETIRVPKGVIN